MTGATLIQFALALAQMILAPLIWHRSMPRLREARGFSRSICIWVLGIALALNGSALLAVAMAGRPIDWVYFWKDFAFLAYAICQYRRTLTLSTATWRDCPRGREA